MTKDNITLMQEFHKTLKDTYPQLTEKQIASICFSPWIYLKNSMENGELIDVRFEFFGKFTVLEGRVEAMKKKNEENLKKGNLSQENYEYYLSMFSKYEENNK